MMSNDQLEKIYLKTIKNLHPTFVYSGRDDLSCHLAVSNSRRSVNSKTISMVHVQTCHHETERGRRENGERFVQLKSFQAVFKLV